MIDVNASLGTWPFGRLAYSTPQRLLKLMDSLKIAQAWVAPLEGLFYHDVQAANRQIHGKVAKFRRRLLPFSVINPNFPGREADLEECVTELRTTGLRLFPSYHGYEIGDACSQALFAEAERRGLPVQIVPQILDDRMHHPRAHVLPASLKKLPEVLKAFPNLRVMILNATPGVLPDRKRLWRFDNFFLDMAWADGADCVNRLASHYGREHVVFGTNTPVMAALGAIYKMQESDLDKKGLAAVTRGNARRFLGERR